MLEVTRVHPSWIEADTSLLNRAGVLVVRVYAASPRARSLCLRPTGCTNVLKPEDGDLSER